MEEEAYNGRVGECGCDAKEEGGESDAEECFGLCFEGKVGALGLRNGCKQLCRGCWW